MTHSRRSLRSALLTPVIRVIGGKKTLSSPELTIRGARESLIRPESYAPPKNIDASVRISVREVGGWPVYTVTPKTGAVNRRAVYVHGGTWIHEISPFHWWLVAGLAASTGTEFTVPIYPLAPRGTAAEVVSGVADLAAGLVAEAGSSAVLILGDSAGGNIALAAAMLLRDRGVDAPRDIVLIAPVIDLTFSDPLIFEIEPSDPWLDVPGPKAVAELWRGGLPIDHPLVSPVNAPLAGIGRITLFSGTRDITHADAITLAKKARAEGHPLDFHQKANMIHVYPLLPIPEGAEARETIKDVLRADEWSL